MLFRFLFNWHTFLELMQVRMVLRWNCWSSFFKCQMYFCQLSVSFSILMSLVGRQEGHLACKDSATRIPNSLLFGDWPKAYITFTIRLWYDYKTTIPQRIWLRQKWSKLQFAFDLTAIWLQHDTTNNWHVHFLLVSNGSRRAQYIVVGL